MQQPQNFFDSTHPRHVCKPLKSFYGLEQAPRAWFDCFTSHLLTLRFQGFIADSSLFVRHKGGSITYLYVDDIILIETDASYIGTLISQL